MFEGRGHRHKQVHINTFFFMHRLFIRADRVLYMNIYIHIQMMSVSSEDVDGTSL